MYVYIGMYMCPYVYVYMYICMYLYIYIFIVIRLCIYICIHLYLYIYLYLYIEEEKYRLGGTSGDERRGPKPPCGLSGRDLRPGKSEDSVPDSQITPTPPALRPTLASMATPRRGHGPSRRVRGPPLQRDHRRVRAGRCPRARMRKAWDLANPSRH